jgi:hypothetical protein
VREVEHEKGERVWIRKHASQGVFFSGSFMHYSENKAFYLVLDTDIGMG